MTWFGKCRPRRRGRWVNRLAPGWVLLLVVMATLRTGVAQPAGGITEESTAARPIPVESDATSDLRWDQLNPRRWFDLADSIVQMRKNFERLGQERTRMMEELDEAKRGHDPAAMDPASIVRRQQIERLLAQLHENVIQQRRIQRQAGSLWRSIQSSPEAIRPVLERLSDFSHMNDDARKRLDEWLGAMRALEQDEPENAARQLFGALLGPLAFRHTELPEDGPDAATEEAMRQAWLRREQQLAELQSRCDELTELVKRQQRDIEQLRRMLEAAIAARTGEDQ